MRIYIIHSPSTSENYIDKTLSAEQYLIEQGHHVMNPMPDQQNSISNKELHDMYGHKIRDCEAAYAMEGWDKTDIGNAEMAELMIHRKTIMFEQQV